MTTWPAASTPWTWNTDLAISRPIVVIVCMFGSSKWWGLNSTHIHGTHVPVEEPSTASIADSCTAAIFCPIRGNSAHVRGTHVPVEEPSTASQVDISPRPTFPYVDMGKACSSLNYQNISGGDDESALVFCSVRCVCVDCV